MGVDLGGSGVGVAEDLLYVVDTDAGHGKPAAAGVAQGVPGGAGNLGFA